MKIGTGTIVGLILGLIFLTVLLSVADDTIPTAATAYHNLSDTIASNTDVFGTDAASFAGDTDGYLGWFWVIGPFVMVIMLVLSLFRGRR